MAGPPSDSNVRGGLCVFIACAERRKNMQENNNLPNTEFNYNWGPLLFAVIVFVVAGIVSKVLHWF